MRKTLADAIGFSVPSFLGLWNIWVECIVCQDHVKGEPMWDFMFGYGYGFTTAYICLKCAPDKSDAIRIAEEGF